MVVLLSRRKATDLLPLCLMLAVFHQELLDVKEERVAYLEAAQKDSAEDVEYFGDEVARAKTAMDDDENAQGELLQGLKEELASAANNMERFRVQLWVRWASDSRHLKQGSREPKNILELFCLSNDDEKNETILA